MNSGSYKINGINSDYLEIRFSIKGFGTLLRKIVSRCAAASNSARLIGHRASLAALRLDGPPSPLAHDPHCILSSTLLCHRSLPSPLTGRVAQPPEFCPHDVVGLTWSPLLIPPPSRLAALIRPFLELNFPQSTYTI